MKPTLRGGVASWDSGLCSYPDFWRHLESPNHLEFLLVKARHWSFLVLQFWDCITMKWKQRKQQKPQTNLTQFRTAQPLFLLQPVAEKFETEEKIRCWISKMLILLSFIIVCLRTNSSWFTCLICIFSLILCWYNFPLFFFSICIWNTYLNDKICI